MYATSSDLFVKQQFEVVHGGAPGLGNKRCEPASLKKKGSYLDHKTLLDLWTRNLQREILMLQIIYRGLEGCICQKWKIYSFTS